MNNRVEYFGDLTVGSLKNMCDKLGGVDNFIASLEEGVSIKFALEYPIDKPILCTVSNMYKTAQGYREATKKYHTGIIPYDRVSAWDFTVPQEDVELDLVVVSIGDLGYTNGGYMHDLLRMAQTGGLEPCPAWVGPQLRLQYDFQNNDDSLTVGMHPITNKDGNNLVFVLNNGDDRGATIDIEDTDNKYRCDIVEHSFVFVRPRKR